MQEVFSDLVFFVGVDHLSTHSCSFSRCVLYKCWRPLNTAKAPAPSARLPSVIHRLSLSEVFETEELVEAEEDDESLMFQKRMKFDGYVQEKVRCQLCDDREMQREMETKETIDTINSCHGSFRIFREFAVATSTCVHRRKSTTLLSSKAGAVRNNAWILYRVTKVK